MTTAPALAYDADRRAVDGHPLRPVGTGPPADLNQSYHGKRGRLSAGQLPLASAPAANSLDHTLLPQAR